MYDVHIYQRIRGFTVSEPTQQSVKCPKLEFVAPQTGTPTNINYNFPNKASEFVSLWFRTRCNRLSAALTSNALRPDRFPQNTHVIILIRNTVLGLFRFL